MPLGLQNAYGAMSLQEVLRQHMLDRIAEEERKRKGDLAEREMTVQERQMAANEALRRDALAETMRQHTLQDEERQMGRDIQVGEQVPPGRTFAPTDPVVAGLKRIGLAEHQDPTLASTQLTGVSELPGQLPTGKSTAIKGTLRMMAQAGNPEQYVKLPSAKQSEFATKLKADEQAKADAAEAKTEAQRQRQQDVQENLRLAASLRPPKDTSASDANRLDRSYQYHRSALDKLAKPLEDQQARMGRLIETVNQGTPQADALVAPELLTVMAGGTGSGLRMNEAEIARIIGGRSKWETLKATLQQWSTNPANANSITSEQRSQIRKLVAAVHDKSQKALEAVNSAGDTLVDAPDESTHRRVLSETRKQLQQINEGSSPLGAGADAGVEEWVRDPKTGKLVKKSG